MTDGFKRFARYPGAYRPIRGSTFRIYRDVHFSQEKCPNKEHAACHFRRALGNDVCAPGSVKLGLSVNYSAAMPTALPGRKLTAFKKRMPSSAMSSPIMRSPSRLSSSMST